MKPVLRWVLALGLTGFLCGFLGPMLLAPGANQGPLLGIFITGPAGALTGLALGALARVLPWPARVERWALVLCCALLGLATLGRSLPEPRNRALLLEANVIDCLSPAAFESEAMADWEARVAKVDWAAPRSSWQDEARRLFARPDGVVLDLEVQARRVAREHLQPWDRGRTTVEPVAGVGDVTRVFARYAGASCSAYPSGPAILYYELTVDPQPGPWPPDDLPGLLSLVVAGPPPAAYFGDFSSSG